MELTAAELAELINELAETPDVMARLARDLSPEVLRRRQADGGFSILENICHLRDLEVEAYSVRMNLILNEERPALADLDGARLAMERDYNRQDVVEAQRAFADARGKNIEIVRHLEPAQFERIATLEGVGEITLARLLSLMSEHDAGHRDEVKALRRQVDQKAASGD
jgi:hypothetical protein